MTDKPSVTFQLGAARCEDCGEVLVNVDDIMLMLEAYAGAYDELHHPRGDYTAHIVRHIGRSFSNAVQDFLDSGQERPHRGQT